MYNMRSASVRTIQHNLNEVLSWVERGEEVLVVRRKKVVAKLVPPGPARADTPDFVVRAQRVWGRRPRGKRLSDLVAEARNDR
jgi:antitoxin (DNA-binding transcriptional repressor) of toxin-antitoxin stability system